MERVKKLMEKDQALRKNIADLFVTLNELNDPRIAIEMLADHIAMMVEMLNEFKKSAGK
jgi:5'-deoxynucleotidase YfbR-like HD superfamily hydrolase